MNRKRQLCWLIWQRLRTRPWDLVIVAALAIAAARGMAVGIYQGRGPR